MGAGAAPLLQAPCEHPFLLSVEVKCSCTRPTKRFLSKGYIARLPTKSKLGNGILCHTHKEGSDGINSIDYVQRDTLNNSQGGYEKEEESDAQNEYKVDCCVEVISWRERRITASVIVEASPQRVWEVLTDYERLSEFIPNLVCSEKIPCPFPGRIWLLQRGMQRMMYWNIEAHVVLDLREFPLLGELQFFMVDGDFKRYDGRWHLQTGPRPQTTLLHYEVNVVPKVIFPAAFIESIIKADLPRNLCAIARRAEADLESQLSKVTEKQFSLQSAHNDTKVGARRNASKGVGDLYGSGFGGFGRTCKLGNHCLVDEIHFRRLDDLLKNGGVHRQVVASITVKASSKDVWRILTAYESLPEFIPNLANSTVLSREGKRVRLLQEGCKCLLYMVLHARVVLDLWEQPEQEISFKQVEGDFDSFKGRWTLNQLGSQHTVLKYEVDTKIWKDCILAESLVEEVIYEDLPSNLCAIRDQVESLANGLNSTAADVLDHAVLSLPELPSTSAKLEPVEAVSSVSDSEEENSQERSTCQDSSLDAPKRRSRGRRGHVKGLMTDYSLMEREIREFIAAYGREGVMPMRKDLRRHLRSDLEKAIGAMGGFSIVAARMKLLLSYKERKPAGYWDDVRNLRNEVVAAQKEIGVDPTVLPSRLSLERLGKFSLARALEKWGGAKETARILGLKAKSSKRQERCRKEQPPPKESHLTPIVEPACADKPIASDQLEIDQGKLAIKRSFKADAACRLSLERYLSSVASDIEKASEVLSRKEVASSPISITQNHSKATSTKAISDPLVEDNPPPITSDKKLPFKTGVPQESSKWLTLLEDLKELDSSERS